MITKFNDGSLSVEERIDWLLKSMNIEEKIDYLSGRNQNHEKYGLTPMYFGGEAAHGAENRNDQNRIGTCDYTTSFPQPFGMSSSFDKELIKKAGEVTGTEVRAAYKRHPGEGLSRWAPTVDIERDPRWGRNEESYGEDPFLTGEMASAYIQGMQGDSKKYLRIASSLKHFYANNVEDGRTYKNSSVDARNKYELYLEPFRRCIEKGGAEGVMTAYNKINGTPGIINSDVQNILKNQYGVTHAVSDGGATQMVVIDHGYFKSHAESVAAALKAGIDSFSDNPKFVYKALKDAYEYGMVDEGLIDRAIRNCLRTRIRLGIFDEINNNPYDIAGEADLCSEYGKEICKILSDESIVLLRNENLSLPLNTNIQKKDVVVIGPMADSWFTDWYGGTPEYKSTFKDGIESVLGGEVCTYDGFDRVILHINNSYVSIDDNDNWIISDKPEEFILGDWGEGNYTLKSVKTGKYALTDIYNDENLKTGVIKVNKDEPFDWFVTELFHIEDDKDSSVDGKIIVNRYDSNFTVLGDGRIAAKKIYTVPGDLISVLPGEETDITIEVIESGIEKSAQLASSYKNVIMAMGCCSTICAKEQVDRSTIELSDKQKSLIDAILPKNPTAVMALFTNYPYAFNGVNKLPDGIIMSATGSQDMGSAMADAIFGKTAPAGRTNMTWYLSDTDLPDINDYDIIKGKRTYRFFDGDVLYPFGYGLTYTNFKYSDITAKVRDFNNVVISFDVTNEGKITSDEVVQVYFIPPKTRTVRSICQLAGFERLHDIMPGEKRTVTVSIPYEELRFFDVVSDSLIIEEGEYTFFAGKSSRDNSLSVNVFINGVKTKKRQAGTRILCDRYDDYENIQLVEGICGFEAVTPLDCSMESKLVYKDFEVKSKWTGIKLFSDVENDFQADIFINGNKAGSFGDDNGIDLNASKEHVKREASVIESDIIIPIQIDDNTNIADLEIRFSGNNAKICYIEILD